MKARMMLAALLALTIGLFTAAAGEKIVIGCTLQNMSEEYMTMLRCAMEIQLREYGDVELIMNDGEGKPDKQASQLDTFIAQKVDAVIICPTDANALTPAVAAVVKAGIPIVTCSADVSENVGQVWIGSENENGGEIEAKFMVEALGGKGNLAILRGPLGHFAEQGRFAGYENVLKQYPDIKVVYDQTANWFRDQAMSQVENLLTSGTAIDGILCQNDGMALGAMEAAKAAGKNDAIVIAGIDAILDALDAVKSGDLDATCFQDAIGQGKGALDMAVRAARGEKIQRTNIPFEIVTKANVDSYYSRIKLPD